MFLTIIKEDVIEGLQKAASIIPQKTGAAYLRSIWLKAENGVLELLSTDSNLEFKGSYPATITQGGFVGVQGRAFVELLRRLPNGEITLSLDSSSNVLKVEQGRRNYKIPINDATWFQNFSDFPEEGAIMWSGDYLQELLDRIIYCIGDEGMDALACMCVKPAANDSIEVVGMNGHQFAMMRFTHDTLRDLLPPEGILIQKKYLNEMKKWLGTDEVDVNINEKRLFLRTSDKKENFSLPLSSFQYPEYNAFLMRLSAETVTQMTVERGELQDALQRITIFNTESNRCTYFELKEKEAVLTATGVDTGSAVETLDIDYAGDIKKIAFPTNNLLGILDHYVSHKLEFIFTGSEGPCGVRGVDDVEYTVIIMPMKIADSPQLNEEQV